MFDTVINLETPEGATLQLHPAGPVVRALAWSIDLAIRAIVLLLLGMALSRLGDFGVGIYLLLVFLLEWFYNQVFEVLRGATPGKRALGLQVVHDDGTPIGWSASLLRNLLRVVDFMPLLYTVGLVWSMFHPQGKRLGDLAAGTLVVHRAGGGHYRLPEALDDVAAQAVPTGLDYQTQQAIVSFAERSPALADARRIELAELLQPLHGAQGTAAVTQILAYARWVAGKA